jgi:hypothetical protein
MIQKLLQLEAELVDEAGSDRELPDFWTKELQCGLRLNLSIAYKTIGQMHHAEHHARKYISLLEPYEFGISVHALLWQWINIHGILRLPVHCVYMQSGHWLMLEEYA